MSKHRLTIVDVFLLLLLILVTATATSAAGSAPLKKHQPKPCTRPNETALYYRGDGTYLGRIYEALTTCPNITSLDLDFVWSGCIPPEDPWAFTFREGDKFPNLRKLGLSDYDLEDRDQWRPRRWSLPSKAQEAIGKLFPSSSRTDLQIRESNLERWTQVMNFSELRELHLGSGNKHFYERMKHELFNLNTLSMTSPSTESLRLSDEKLIFLQSVPSLESLSIRIGAPYEYNAPPILNRTEFPLHNVLPSHGQKLRSLSLTQSESSLPYLRRPMLSLEDLSAIRTSCPALTHLGLDIDRNGSWPNSTFDSLTSIESLTSLTLNLEIGADLHRGDHGHYDWNPKGLEGEGPWREPRMSLDVAEKLFRDLMGKKQGRELERLEFGVGDYTEVPYSGPLYLPRWGEGRARKFICETDGRDRVGVGRGKGDETSVKQCRIIGGKNFMDEESRDLHDEL